jgi:hypothetical protein
LRWVAAQMLHVRLQIWFCLIRELASCSACR